MAAIRENTTCSEPTTVFVWYATLSATLLSENVIFSPAASSLFCWRVYLYLLHYYFNAHVPSKPPLKIRAQFCNIWGTHKMSCEV